MPSHVLGHERRAEIIAVVVPPACGVGTNAMPAGTHGGSSSSGRNSPTIAQRSMCAQFTVHDARCQLAMSHVRYRFGNGVARSHAEASAPSSLIQTRTCA